MAQQHPLSIVSSATLAGVLAACTDVPVAPRALASASGVTSALASSAGDRGDDGGRDRPDGRGSDRAARALAHTALSGGAMTVFDATLDAFSLPAPNLAGDEIALHDEGDEAFDTGFSAAPDAVRPGLGPIFDNTACSGCHPGDGRGRPPLAGEAFASMLFRASVPGVGPHGGPNPVPGFGGQLQMRAIDGMAVGVVADVTYTDSIGTFADGTTYTLRVPRYRFSNAWSLLPAALLISPRAAPPVFGLGLLEAVPDMVVRGLADPSDRNRDGISGRANLVWDVPLGRYVLGRFGWKANTGSLLHQTAGAYNGDMGITSTLFPAEPCEDYRKRCDRHPIEIDDDEVHAATFYQQTLAVPARRALDDPQVLEGEEIFFDAGCARCHAATLPTAPLPGAAAVAAGLIHPYTDLLLHDMGPALEDGRPDFLATGSEWRTAPLWGIGLTLTVNGHTNFLHDGRARTLLEAVLWHGGEAADAREEVQGLPQGGRAALVAFLQSL